MATRAISTATRWTPTIPNAPYRAMTPLVTERLGAGTPAWDHWAFHPALRIMYVNSFRRLGARGPDGMSDVFTVVHAQRACRAFSDAPVGDADLARILDAAVHAPSAENKQPWEFVVVRDAAARAAIGALMTRAWETAGRAFSQGRLPGAHARRGRTGRDRRDRGRAGPRGGRRRHPAGPRRGGGRVDLPGGAEPVARGHRARPRHRAHHHRARLRRRAPGARRLPATTCGRWPWSRSATRPGVLGPSRRDPFAEHTHREQYGSPWGSPDGSSDQGTVGSA